MLKKYWHGDATTTVPLFPLIILLVLRKRSLGAEDEIFLTELPIVLGQSE